MALLKTAHENDEGTNLTQGDLGEILEGEDGALVVKFQNVANQPFHIILDTAEAERLRDALVNLKPVRRKRTKKEKK